MNQLLSIVDDGLVIKKLSVQTLDGPVQANDDVRVSGNIFVDRDIKARRNMEVAGTLTVDTLKVKNIVNEITPNANEDNSNTKYTFAGHTESDLDGQGLVWLDKELGSKQFVYKPGNKIWSTMSIDLARDRTFQINKLPVLSATELGSSVIKSNLRKVGELEGLTVSGSVKIDGWAFFNNFNNTLGLNTENPNGTFGVVVDNNVEVIIGSKEHNVATLGTFTSNALDIVTDNKTRITVKDTGDVVFGNAKFKNAYVRIHGKLEVDELVSQVNDRDQNIIFKPTENSGLSGKGIVWTENGKIRQLLYLANPDRLSVSEVIDLHENKYYSIDNSLVLSRTRLGESVTETNIEKLGTLRELTVEGISTFTGPVHIDQLNVGSITAEEAFTVRVNNEDEIKVKANGIIEIGSDENLSREINVHGQTNFYGQMSLNKKRIITGKSAPASGPWNRGDICYNEEPDMEGFIGWVCVQSGDPGRWCPFGLIMPVRS